MPKPVCVPCQRFYRPERNGFYLVEGMPRVNGAKPGLEEPQNWKPYKLWIADKWKCQGCGHEIVVGFAHAPLAEHHQDNFDQMVKITGATLQINDC